MKAIVAQHGFGVPKLSRTQARPAVALGRYQDPNMLTYRTFGGMACSGARSSWGSEVRRRSCEQSAHGGGARKANNDGMRYP
jgi:hypothetical protein